MMTSNATTGGGRQWPTLETMWRQLTRAQRILPWCMLIAAGVLVVAIALELFLPVSSYHALRDVIAAIPAFAGALTLRREIGKAVAVFPQSVGLGQRATWIVILSIGLTLALAMTLDQLLSTLAGAPLTVRYYGPAAAALIALAPASGLVIASGTNLAGLTRERGSDALMREWRKRR